MAPDDDLPEDPPAPRTRPGSVPPDGRPAEGRDDRPRDERLNERLTERIRQGAGADPRPDLRDDKLNETIRQRLEHLVPELVKKTFAAGMGAVFSTEEGIRKIARDVSLPDVVGYVASSADGAKDKVFEVIARETRDFLSNLNLTEEIAKILTTLSFEVKTEIRFIPNSERLTGAEPDVKASVRLKRNDRGFADRDKDRDRDEDPRDSRSRLRFWRRDEAGGEPGDGEPGEK